MDCTTQVTFEALRDKLNRYLTKNPKHRKTERRETVLKVLYEARRHLTPDEVYHELYNRYDSTIGIATVYRSLGLFEDAGLVSVLAIGNETKKYEIKCDRHHDHMVCVRCGVILEFSEEAIEELQRTVAKAHGFKLLDHELVLHGVCSECQRGETERPEA